MSTKKPLVIGICLIVIPIVVAIVGFKVAVLPLFRYNYWTYSTEWGTVTESRVVNRGVRSGRSGLSSRFFVNAKVQSANQENITSLGPTGKLPSMTESEANDVLAKHFAPGQQVEVVRSNMFNDVFVDCSKFASGSEVFIPCGFFALFEVVGIGFLIAWRRGVSV